MNANVSPAVRLKIQGMDCGSCALTIEQAVRTVPGIASVRVDFTTETLEATGSASRGQIESRVRDLGYCIADGIEQKQAPRPELRGPGGFLRFLAGERRTQIALAATVLIIVAAVIGPVILEAALLATVVVVGAPILLKGLRSLLVARHVTIDLLMGIATVGAVAIGETGEAAAVVLLFTLGEALEAYSAERSRDALRSLLSLQPDEATVLEAHSESHAAPDDHGHQHGTACAHDDHDDHGHDHAPKHKHEQHEHGAACAHDEHDHRHDHGHGHAHEHGHDHKAAAPVPATALHFHQRRQPTASVPVGAHILVRPGERIPLDGRILDGASSINQAAVTGESMPVDRTVGDEVLAGTVNGPGALTVEVLRTAGLSTVTRIAQMVERALAERTPAERFIDRFARWYTPLVVALAALLVAIPVLAFGQPFLDLADGTRGWLYRGLAMLIIACPCALIISIPVTVVSALARLAQLGVLVKGGAQLDRLAGVNIIAFDKTGTLTVGQPAVTAIRGKDCEHPVAANDDCVTCEDLVAVATAVESASEHPLAQAVVASAQSRGVANRLPQAANIKAHLGRGVSGDLAGERIAVGTHELFSHDADCKDEVCTAAAGLQATGKTVMLVGRGANMLGYIGVEDQPRPDAPAALAELHALNGNVKTVMLTGDNRSVANSIARQIGGIDEVRASLLPEHKQSVVRELQQRGTVAMIGDGINDAPALAQADIGIAMGGGGTAQAMETADVVLMQDKLHAVAQTLRISRLTRTVVKQNIVLSLGLKLIVLGLAIPGIASLWLAVLADVGATLIVTLNGMRMLRAR